MSQGTALFSLGLTGELHTHKIENVIKERSQTQ